MKIYLVFAILFLFALGTSTCLFAQAAAGTEVSYATGYKSTGFSGESEKFLIGEYNQMEKGWKDEIKSIALNGAVRVTLFDKEKFEGKKIVIEQSTYDLGDFNGEAASMIVEPFSCAYAIAYKKTIFQGNPKQFAAGKYEKLTDGWDDIQSVDLCGSVTVTLYTKENFQGESLKVDKDRIDLGKFNKKAKSMVVEVAAATP